MLYLAFKQLAARPQQTLLTFLAILIGTAGYIVLSSFMLGFQEYLIDRLVNNDSHVRISARDEIINEATFRDVFFERTFVHWVRPPGGRTDASRLTNVQAWYERLESNPQVEAFAPQLVRQVIFTNRNNTGAATLVGFDVPQQIKVTNIEKFITVGNLSELTRSDANVILGDALMQRLGAQVGDSVNVIGPNRSLLPARIVGVYSSGTRQIDQSRAFASLRAVQTFSGSIGEVSDIVVRLHDVEKAAEMALYWRQFTTDKVESWDQANEGFLSMFQMQNIMRNSITFVIVLIVAFGIYNILNMVVNHKKRDIAILRSMGYSRQSVAKLFLLQGSLLGLLGALLGLAIGYIACTRLQLIEIGVPGGRNHLLLSFSGWIYLRGFLITLSASLLASWLPARVASRLAPIEIIRGET
ncbi:MAG: ABC transporter permease [Spirochaetales bacterium]|nr:ABC transporter permease [Leptospiraceae bacterium]MCP5481484.1 ABC transporter permease [Spirochaetales bacterium]MCP5484313.1 ABC transporter permease [Spirochaetales bacterium]